MVVKWRCGDVSTPRQQDVEPKLAPPSCLTPVVRKVMRVQDPRDTNLVFACELEQGVLLLSS